MPKRAVPKPCLIAGCKYPTFKGPRCVDHEAGYQRARNKLEYRQPYNAYVYRELRKQLLAKYPCAHCGSWGKRVLDHTLPLLDGGTNSIENLQVLCLECHQVKTQADRLWRKAKASGYDKLCPACDPGIPNCGVNHDHGSSFCWTWYRSRATAKPKRTK
jgi:5-methylcytosine-specific restriction enzyme A